MTASSSRTVLFSGGLRDYPGIPEEWSPAKKAVALATLADVHAALPGHADPADADPSADIEDFWEDACRVSAAWAASHGDFSHVDGKTQWSDEEMTRRLGPVMRSEEGGHHAGDNLIGHPIVRQYGGRGMLLGSINADLDIADWFASRYRDHGVRRGVVKNTEHKGGIWSIELSGDPEIVRQRLFDEMDWTLVRLEGTPGALLAQDALELQYEYRLFVVDGEVVDGAGCIEEFTPLDRTKPNGSFDTRVRRVRGHLNQGQPSPVESQIEIVARLIQFGRRVAKAHAGTVVIDVALDAAAGGHGQPVVIELNSISNSGLYASNPWIVTEKLVHANDRGYLL